jgi:transcriptional regulator with XRE-family HTH domain
MTTYEAQSALSANMRDRRLALELTQAGLSKRSGVALATLRRFEQTGAVSIESLFKLMAVVGGLQEVIDASAPKKNTFSSIDDVLSGTSKPSRKRGTRK